jgi:hypothetical protein
MAHPHPKASAEPGLHPTPQEVLALRSQHHLSQSAAAALAYSSLRSWQHWEAGTWKMHPAIWRWVQHELAGRARQDLTEIRPPAGARQARPRRARPKKGPR